MDRAQELIERLGLIPHPERVIAELMRVTRPGGCLHVIAEDYGMIHFERSGSDLQQFWHTVSDQVGAATGTDMYIGRHLFGVLSAAKLQDISLDYVVVDTLDDAVLERVRTDGRREHAASQSSSDPRLHVRSPKEI